MSEHPGHLVSVFVLPGRELSVEESTAGLFAVQVRREDGALTAELRIDYAQLSQLYSQAGFLLEGRYPS